ncbi:MAG: hypothetical protein KIH08_12320 [Candidatus Freyarchaeota archaeon]|nr:hypothetical protein [Candidatus Jordarchaeia archaeon]MBS7270347.1 hypothetical protein [Candidatus Jordarchaeia archaeon]MBS7281089.1 hypothetical protein [Candidatus Jordarchaeia archaeon]
MSAIHVVVAIFEEELKAILAEKQAKRGKKSEFHEEHSLSQEELSKIVDFIKNYLSSSNIDVEAELNCLLEG